MSHQITVDQITYSVDVKTDPKLSTQFIEINGQIIGSTSKGETLWVTHHMASRQLSMTKTRKAGLEFIVRQHIAAERRLRVEEERRRALKVARETLASGTQEEIDLAALFIELDEAGTSVVDEGYNPEGREALVAGIAGVYRVQLSGYVHQAYGTEPARYAYTVGAAGHTTGSSRYMLVIPQEVLDAEAVEELAEDLPAGTAAAVVRVERHLELLKGRDFIQAIGTTEIGRPADSTLTATDVRLLIEALRESAAEAARLHQELQAVRAQEAPSEAEIQEETAARLRTEVERLKDQQKAQQEAQLPRGF